MWEFAREGFFGINHLILRQKAVKIGARAGLSTKGVLRGFQLKEMR